MTKRILTQTDLKKQLSYNPDTGIFIWIEKRAGVKFNSVAGSYSKQGYFRITINHIEYKAHRLAWLYMTGEMPKEFIDHINGDRLDNRFCNLREATNTQNNYNTGMLPTNTSGIKGVRINKKTGRWHAQASVKGKNKHLGMFETAEMAKAAYDSFVKMLHGDFYKPV